MQMHNIIIKLHLLIKSGGQTDGQMSFQSTVVWRYREVNCKVVGMCVEAGPVLGAEDVLLKLHDDAL
jgi:hypothetical protein